jgi:serine/threonine-protein kinase RsbT
MRKFASSRARSAEPSPTENRVRVATDTDIVEARQVARALAEQLGFSAGDATVVATVVSELARNIVEYASPGEISIQAVENGSHRGVLMVASDNGPGIRDVSLAMRDGFSTAGRLGLGLPGVRRLMDSFEIISGPGRGTRITVKKWISRREP